MRFLCLHGKGTSGEILRSQTTGFRDKLRLRDPSITFDFVDGPHASSPAPGVDLFYSPPYYAYWNEAAVPQITAAHEWLLEYIERNGPYDGVLTFSQGASLASSLLLYRQVRQPERPPVFKTAIFICGGIPLCTLEDLGVPVSEEALEVDQRSMRELSRQSASEAILSQGNDRWSASDHNSTTYDDASLDAAQQLFGLDFTQIPSNYRIKIPTVHVYGSKDPRHPAGLKLARLCESSPRKIYDHKDGHTIPRTNETSQTIAELVLWAIEESQG